GPCACCAGGRLEVRRPLWLQQVALRQALSSAGCLAATGHVDLFLECCQPDSADHRLVADHVARRAVEPHGFGDLEALSERVLPLVARSSFREAALGEPDLSAPRDPSRLVGRAATAEELLMKLEIFLAGLVLHPHRDRNLRGLRRTLAEHREFLEHDLDLWISLHEIEHVGHSALAVAAVVVEQLHKGDIALWVADRYLAR